MEFGNGFGSMGHGGRGLPAVFRNVKTTPVDEVLQLAAGEARILDEVDFPFFVTVNQIRWWRW